MNTYFFYDYLFIFQRKEVQNLWALRDALQLIPLSDPECQLLVEKLIACSSNTLFVSCDEGIKWLSGLFSRESMVIPMHRGIKTVLPGCTRAQSSKYAEVYFRSWKNSQGTVKQVGDYSPSLLSLILYLPLSLSLLVYATSLMEIAHFPECILRCFLYRAYR